MFFACLALHKIPEKLANYLSHNSTLCLTKTTNKLCREFTKEPFHAFPGVRIDQIDQIEHIFQIGVKIYTVKQENQKRVALLVRRPNPNYKDLMCLDLSETEAGVSHFSYIYDVSAYSKAHECGKCGQLWDRAYH